MIRGDKDIDNRRAEPWQKKKMPPRLLAASKNITSRQQLFEAVKDTIVDFATAVYGDHDDQKYKRCVNLLLLRMKSDFNELPFVIQVNESAFQSIIDEALQNAYDNNDEGFPKFTSLAEQFLKSIKRFFGISSNDKSSHDNKTDSKNNELNENAAFDVFERIESIVKKMNDMMFKLSNDIQAQFTMIESMIMGSMMSLSQSSVDMSKSSSVIDRLNSLQMGHIEAKDKKTRKKLEKNGFDIDVAGMKMNTKIIDTLSVNSMKSAIYVSAVINLHYIALKNELQSLQQLIQKHVKQANDMIDIMLEHNFMSFIGKYADKILNFAKKNIFDPLKDKVIKYIISKIPSVLKLIKQVFDAFLAGVVLAFRALRFVFKMIWRFISGLFKQTIRLFVKTMRGLMKAALATLRMLWRMIWWTIRVTAKGIAWVTRWAWRGTKFIFEKIKNSKFGKKIGEMFSKVKGFFAKIHQSVKTKFSNIGQKMAGLKDKISEKLSKVKTKIKEIGVNIRTRVKTYIDRVVTKIKTRIRTGIRKVKIKMRKAIRKIPGAKFIRLMRVKVKKYLAHRAFKKKMKDGIIKKIIKGLAKKLGKVLGKMSAKVLFGSVAGVLTAGLSFAVTWGWMTYDIMNLYKALERFFMPAAQTLGYDTERPAWFVKFLWEQQMEIKRYLIENYDEFLKALQEGLNNALYGMMNKAVILAMYNNERHAKAKGRWAWYQQNVLNSDAYKKIGNPESLLKTLRTNYKMMISTAVQIRKLNEEIADAANKMGSFDFNDETTTNVAAMYWHKHQFESEVARVFQEKFKLRMDAIDDFMKYAILAGMFRVFPGGPDKSPLARFISNPWPEEDVESFLALYNEAYAGIMHIDFLLNRKKINTQLKENIKEQEKFHKNARLDVEKLKKVLKEHVDDENRFYETVQKVKNMIMTEGIKINEEIEKFVSDEDAANASSDTYIAV